MSVSVVARKYGIAPNLVFRWRKLMNDGGKVAIQAALHPCVAQKAMAWQRPLSKPLNVITSAATFAPMPRLF
jgi:transposase-like protein